MSIRDLSIAELEAELARRKSAPHSGPVVLEKPDFASLVKCITDGVARTVTDKYEDEDFKYYVYEEAIEAVYGKSFWEWKRANSI